MPLLLTIVFGVLFGAADQYLGSLKPMVALGPWTVSVSQMSAPWLLLPFVLGCTLGRSRRPMLLGLVGTLSALAGYFAMTVSPIEGVPVADIPRAAAGLVSSNLIWIAGALLVGPAFGLLGQRWATMRSWAAASLVAGAFLLEPVLRSLHAWGPSWTWWPNLLGPAWIWAIEAGVGAGLAVLFAVGIARERRLGDVTRPLPPRLGSRQNL